MNSDIVLNIRHKKAAPGAAYAFFLKEKLLFLRFGVWQVGDAAFEHFRRQANGLVQSRVSVDGQGDVFSVWPSR